MRRDSLGSSKGGDPISTTEEGGPEDEKDKKNRKKEREKQRRSELTNAFDEMHTFIMRVDATDDGSNGNNAEGGPDAPLGQELEGSPRKKPRRLTPNNRCESNATTGTNNNADNDGGMTTRVDLINRALGMMKRLHQENDELKRLLASSSGGRESNEVMVMVPTLTPCPVEGDAAQPLNPGPPSGSFQRMPNMPPGFPPPPMPQQDPRAQQMYAGGPPPPPPQHSPSPSSGYPPMPPQPWGAYPGQHGPGAGGNSSGSGGPPPPQHPVPPSHYNRTGAEPRRHSYSPQQQPHHHYHAHLMDSSQQPNGGSRR